MTVDVEIICIGNELLIGKIMNTNSHWLATKATNLGANVQRITVIQDNLSEIAAAINEAKARKPTFIITTGGLGPTSDDITKQTLAEYFNTRLVMNFEVLKMIEDMMNRRNFKMNDFKLLKYSGNFKKLFRGDAI